MAPSNYPASLSNVVFDLMNVEIVHSTLRNNTFEYKICCSEDKTIRQGQFKGPNVQLRLSFFNQGNYSFHLFTNGEQIQRSIFEKRTHTNSAKTSLLQ